MAPRYFILWPCCTWTTTSEYSATFANEETLFELIGAELLVEHSHTAGGFAEAASTELCKGVKGNVE